MGKLALAAIVSSWVVPITIMVNHIVPEPYMVRKSLSNQGNRQLLILKVALKNFSITHIHDLQDEIFHIPQAQQYCKGNFGSWDPMITTPPGLYVLLSLCSPLSIFRIYLIAIAYIQLLSCNPYGGLVQMVLNRALCLKGYGSVLTSGNLPWQAIY